MTAMLVRRRFGHAPTSIGEARRFVAATLADSSGADGVFLDTALLAVSELATNALLHARTEFDVVVDVQDATVSIGVIDGSAELPVVRSAQAVSEGGRGLALIEAVAVRWGTELDGDGKLVWCELELPSSS
jgi:anti-sigma regulatory factor (Ser/Thr protein kinase)